MKAFDRYRRSLLARLLKLPPPRYGVSVQRHIPVPMPDGVRLFTDHYSPKAAGDFPTILIRTPYGRGKEVALWGGYALSELPAQRFAERGYHVIVQGAWSRNLGAGEALAAGVRMAIAEQTVCHDEARPSALVIWVVGGGKS